MALWLYCPVCGGCGTQKGTQPRPAPLIAFPALAGLLRDSGEVALDLPVDRPLEAHEQFLVEHGRDALERRELGGWEPLSS